MTEIGKFFWRARECQRGTAGEDLIALRIPVPDYRLRQQQRSAAHEEEYNPPVDASLAKTEACGNSPRWRRISLKLEAVFAFGTQLVAFCYRDSN